ncbi:uncharacterized protein LOC143914129 [Arctopsyche grandis]|uniref:uncharacterized protein LOC143914129 n=1 Tax=Arctopsyche grandis TaxID=121162 RepID=UPI00406D75DC
MADNPKRLTNHFKFGKTMLSLWGLWPNPTLSPISLTLYKIYGILVLLGTIFPYIICSIVDTVVQFQSGVWMDILPRFSVTLAMMLGCVKISVYLFHTKTIEKYMDAFEDETFTYKTSRYFNPNIIIERCVWLYHAQVSVCMGIIGILIMTNIDTILRDPVISSKNTSIPALPFINWLPYDYSKSPLYEMSFLLTNFWFLISANLIIVYDTICIGLMIHIAGNLKILRLALETLRFRAVDEVDEAIYVKSLRLEKIDVKILEMFKKCAKHHQAIIR